jgi:hypothetical protein
MHLYKEYNVITAKKKLFKKKQQNKLLASFNDMKKKLI